jgi:hypothetical protein
VSQEYEELGANMRHYSGLRFSRLTLFLFASGGLLGAQIASPLERAVALAVPLLGLALTAVFWFMVKRVGLYYWHFRERAEELEASLDYKQYSTLPRQRGVTDVAMALLFLGFIVTWGALFIIALLKEGRVA